MLEALNFFFWLIGLVFSVVGGIALLLIVAWFLIEKIAKYLGWTKMFIEASREVLQRKRHSRPAG